PLPSSSDFRHHFRSCHPTTQVVLILNLNPRPLKAIRHVPYSCSAHAGLPAFRFSYSCELAPAHTISQRLRTLKRVPPELIPLGTSRVAVGAAIYSSTRKLMTDKTLRLYRNSPEDREH
ncbi:uncharacterized protein An02g01710, partial [Aspergillus niger]|uniref:Uncharacterized protein n=2 Tax=Aspergillus niger TaxID=5061 RepID=A0AAJ8E3Z8_ASPNG